MGEIFSFESNNKNSNEKLGLAKIYNCKGEPSEFMNFGSVENIAKLDPEELEKIADAVFYSESDLAGEEKSRYIIKMQKTYNTDPIDIEYKGLPYDKSTVSSVIAKIQELAGKDDVIIQYF